MVAEPVELVQEWRNFDYSSPWESFPKFRESEETKVLEGEKKEEPKK